MNLPLILAPMAGITDYPFRRIARDMGCPLAFTEMISAEGLLRKGEAYLKLRQDEHPIMVQFFGSDAEALAEAVQVAEGMGADGIDINMGCPASQVVSTGAGAGLMKSPDRVRNILTTVRKKVRGPLTIKMRAGWDQGHINAVEISKVAEGCGVDALTLHPRTKDQGFRGKADWKLISEVKRTIKIPVIGNGDVTTAALAREMMDETGCDAVMIGRGALGNPWIFGQASLTQGHSGTPLLAERQGVIERHLGLIESACGDREDLREFRKHVVWYTRGLPLSAALRSSLPGLRGKRAFLEAMASYFDGVRRRGECLSFESTGNNSVTG